MGFGSKIGGIAKSLTLGTAKKVMKYHPAYQIAKKLRGGKRRAGSTSRTSADVTLRRRKAAEAKHDKGQYKQKMKAMKKYKGMRGMKYSGKNKPVTSTADRMQARRRRTAKKDIRSPRAYAKSRSRSVTSSKAKRRSPSRPYSGKPMNRALITKQIAEYMKKKKK